MAELKSWEALEPGGTVLPDEAPRPHTGGWRTGVKPEVDLTKCIDCLLCWVYCPDSAIRVAEGAFTGIDLDFCKGCEICAEVCPTGAIVMAAE